MKRIKQYKILEKLGSGGMGEVYKAFDSVLERDVAIKIMHRHLLSDAANDERFMREARAAARLVHPNVVTIHEVGLAKVGRYIVMEYVNGRPLTQLLAAEGAVSPPRATHFMTQLLSALQRAHALGILHRDIKTDNILVAANDQIKVLDFGIAKMTTKERLTGNGQLLGTIEYMAPEQILGEEVDSRCDLYAAGVVFYQMLTSRLPFPGESPVTIVYKQLNEEPVPPSYYNQQISPRLDQIVLRAIHKNKADRWQTAEEFSDELQKLHHKTTEVQADSDLDVLNPQTATAQETLIDDDAEHPLRSVFVGRDREFKKLVNLFGRVSRGKGQTAVILGEAGVGKSTLADRFRSYAQQSHAWVLYGACLYQEGLDAYLPYIDALSRFFNTDSHLLSEEERSQLKGIIREKVPLLMEFTERFSTTFAPPAPGRAVDPESSQTNLFEGIHILVSLLSTIRPVVLIIDDLQWADEASLRLFHYLCRHVAGNRVLLLGIARTDRYELQHDGKPALIVDVLSRMRREGVYEEIVLDRLSRESCDRLIDESLASTMLSEDFYLKVYSETKGIPFFVVESLKLLRETGAIVFKDGAWYDRPDDFRLEVPDRVEDVFIRRLSGLSDEERETLQVAAVIGHKFDASLLARVIEISKIKLLKSLQRIERELQILSSTEEGFQFEHPMLRDLLYNEIPTALRREYHLMIAAELERSHAGDYGALIGEVAQHFRRGGDLGKAIPLLLQAGLRAFDLAAYREASMFFEDFVESVERSSRPWPSDISESDLFFKLGICYEETGRLDLSLQSFEKLLALEQRDNHPEGQIRALFRIGRVQDKADNWQEALSTYERCLKMVHEHPVANVLSRVYNNLGILYFERGNLDQAIEYFTKTLNSVDSEKGEFDRAHALTNLGIIANIRGDFSLALEHYTKALRIYEVKGDRKSEARVYHNIGMTYSDQGEWTKSIEAFDRCLEVADKTEDKQLWALSYLNMGKAYARQENLSQAQAATEKAFKVFKRMGDMLNVAEAYHVFGLIQRARGNYAEAERFLTESIRINEQKEYREGVAETSLSYANLCRDSGRHDVARKFYEKAAATFRKLNLEAKAEQIEKTLECLSAPGDTEVQVVDLVSGEKKKNTEHHDPDTRVG